MGPTCLCRKEFDQPMGSVVKSGYMKKFSKSMLSGGWKQCYVVLHQDSNFCVYKKQGDSSPMGIVKMFDVRKWFAYGEHTDGMPERPKLPAGCSVKQIIAIPERPSSSAKILWFMCDTEQDTHAWMEAICKTLPAPEGQTQPQQQPLQQAQPQPQVSGMPPPYPGPGLGFESLVDKGGSHQSLQGTGQPPAPGPSAYPQPYPQQVPPQPAYPQQVAYPQQAYPQQPPMQYQQPYQVPPQPAMMGYPQQQYYPQQGYYPQQPGYAGQPNVVYAQNQPQKSGGIMSSDGAKIAAGVAGGYMLRNAMGGGHGGLMGGMMGGGHGGMMGGMMGGHGGMMGGHGGGLFGMGGSNHSLGSFGGRSMSF